MITYTVWVQDTQDRQDRQDKTKGKRKEKERIRESQPKKKDFADFSSHSPENLNCWSSLHCCHHQLN